MPYALCLMPYALCLVNIQLDVEVSRRGELSAASQQLLQRNSQLEARLAEQEAKEGIRHKA